MELLLLLLLLLVFTIISQFLPPASCFPPSNYKHHCDWCPRHSTASLISPPAAAADLRDEDACGYAGAAMATEINGGYVAAAAGAEFFRDGAGCGACYQLRCRDLRVCGDGGVKVVVTDAANRTGFLLASREAFAAMAKDGMADQLQLLAGGGSDNVVVPVDFRR